MEEHNLYLPLLDTMINKDLEANNIWMDVSCKKSHTCEEGGGTTQNFCLAFTDLLEKQLLLKKMLKKANEKFKNFNSSNIVLFFFLIKKYTWWYHYFIPAYQSPNMIDSSWDIECGRLKLVIMGLFLPLYPLKHPQKSEFWKSKTDCWRYHHFTQVYQKCTVTWVTVPDILSETGRIFYPFTP